MTSFPPSARRLDLLDLGILVGLLALLAVYVLETFDATLPPYEDAAILLRYSKHLAEGHGIVWNVGQPPVDGATDFLLMATTAGLGALGLSMKGATFGLGFASHVLTVLVIYAGVRRLHGAPRWMAFLSAAFLALGPGIRYVEAWFGTPFFGLFAATTWYAATRVFRDGETTGRAVAFAVSGLLLGLTRPEGVFLAGFMLAGLVLTRGWARHRRTVLWFVLVYGTLGTGYFVWHWAHFGHPLPNTYYIKGREGVYWGHLSGAARHLTALAKPFLPVLAAAALAELLAGRGSRGEADEDEAGPGQELVFVLFPLAAFIGLSVLHAGLMDYLHRFMYCMLPIVLIGWPPLFARLRELLGVPPFESLDRTARRVAALLVVLAMVGALDYQVATFPTGGHRWWGTYNVGQILRDYRGKDYTIAVTNAGHLPFVSEWNAVDGWGLNDQRIAHEGLSAQILEEWKPEVIQFDAGFSPITGERESPTPWSAATMVMKRYAEANDYELVATYGVTPRKSHYYYVRRDFPDAAAIARRIRQVDYYIGGAPGKCFDWLRVAGGETVSF